MNPIAKVQITQYAKSVADLFKLMIQEKEQEFRARIKQASHLCINHVFYVPYSD